MKIEPINHFMPTFRTGTLTKYTREQIINILGFEPNVEDDPDKVENSWLFKVDGFEAAIWDYKKSHHYNMWSIYDPHNVLGNLFMIEA